MAAMTYSRRILPYTPCPVSRGNVTQRRSPAPSLVASAISARTPAASKSRCEVQPFADPCPNSRKVALMIYRGDVVGHRRADQFASAVGEADQDRSPIVRIQFAADNSRLTRRSTRLVIAPEVIIAESVSAPASSDRADRTA